MLKEFQSKLNKCFNLIEDCFWDLQEIYDETKNIYALKDNNSAILAYGLWKFYLIEEWVKEIEIEKKIVSQVFKSLFETKAVASFF